VGFRYSIARAATLRGVAGWVRNRPDGTVEAVFEGEEERVASMVEWMRRGPSGAHVEDADVTREEPREEQGFSVR
jgi:acylphosphatase